MATYKSTAVKLAYPIEVIYDKITNLSSLQELPQDVREKMGNVEFLPDKIVLRDSPAGNIELRLKEKVEPTKVTYTADNSPVPLDLSINLAPVDDSHTEAHCEISVEIPAIMKPLVGGKLQEAANMFGSVLPSFMGGKA